MAKKAFALRFDERVADAMQRWADDDLRSLNAQIEYVLRESLRKAGRLKVSLAEPVIEEVNDDESRPPDGK